MLVVAIDPGSVRIGLASVTSDGTPDLCVIYPNQEEVRRELEALRDMIVWSATVKAIPRDRCKVVIENFSTAGVVNKDSIATIKQVGYFEGVCQCLGFPYEVVPPDRRRRSLEWAYMQRGLPTILDHDPDDVSALAHAKSEWERLRKGK